MHTKFLPFAIALLAIIAVTFCLQACSGQEEVDGDLTDKITKIKHNSDNNLKKIQTQPPQLPDHIKFTTPNIKAPFQARNTSPVKNDIINVSPLLAYPITMLKLVGTIEDGSTTFAYVLAPDDIVYRVDQGDTLGEKQGKVVSIIPGRVDVMVLEKEEGQVPVQRNVVLELKDEP